MVFGRLKEGSPAGVNPGPVEKVMPLKSSNLNQKITAFMRPVLQNSRSRVLWAESSGGDLRSKCHASTGLLRGVYMPSFNGAPVGAHWIGIG